MRCSIPSAFANFGISDFTAKVMKDSTHVDTQAGPRLLLELRGYVGGVPRQVTHVAQARLDDVSGTQVARDRLGLRR